MKQVADEYGVSSVHVTFPCKDDWQVMARHGFLQRMGMQYHWSNRGYGRWVGKGGDGRQVSVLGRHLSPYAGLPATHGHAVPLEQPWLWQVGGRAMAGRRGRGMHTGVVGRYGVWGVK
ncbi:unnamed protein product [Closterium sp. NIES-64]|nr:unnamed protein product [Closterium sp. NIES-64]